MEKFFVVLGYIWTVLWNVIQLALVLYVFDRLEGRLEFIVVSILGLIYVTMRAIAFNNGRALVTICQGIDKELTRIRELLHDDSPGALTELNDVRVSRAFAKGYINQCFLFLVFLSCLLILFSHL
jgi:hypothetical protein